MIPSRTPKSGLLRKWILLPGRKKVLFAILASTALVITMRAAFAPTRSYEVRHVLSSGEP